MVIYYTSCRKQIQTLSVLQGILASESLLQQTQKGTMKAKTKNNRKKKSLKPRASFFEKIHKINKPLAGLFKKKREWTQIDKIRSERKKL